MYSIHQVTQVCDGFSHSGLAFTALLLSMREKEVVVDASSARCACVPTAQQQAARPSPPQERCPRRRRECAPGASDERPTPSEAR